MLGGVKPGCEYRNTAVPGTRMTSAGRLGDAARRTWPAAGDRADARSATRARPVFHVVSRVRMTTPDDEREPPPSGILNTLASRNAPSTIRITPVRDGDQPQAPAPLAAGVDGEQDRRDEHRAGHREAERGRQPGGRTEHDDETDAGDHQRPVDERHVDLTLRRRRRVHDPGERGVAELDRLPGEREHAGDQRLRGDHRGERRQQHERELQGVRGEQEERALDGLRLAEQQAADAEVGEEQRRHHDRCTSRPGSGAARSGPCRRTAPRRR